MLVSKKSLLEIEFNANYFQKSVPGGYVIERSLYWTLIFMVKPQANWLLFLSFVLLLQCKQHTYLCEQWWILQQEALSME